MMNWVPLGTPWAQTSRTAARRHTTPRSAHRPGEYRELGGVAADRRERGAANAPAQAEDQRRIEREVDRVAGERRAHRRPGVALAIARLAQRCEQEDQRRARRADHEVLGGELARARRCGQRDQERRDQVAGGRRGNAERDGQAERCAEQLGDAVLPAGADRLRHQGLGATQKANAEADQREADDAAQPDPRELVGAEMCDERGRGQGHHRERDHRDRDRPGQPEQLAAGSFDPGQW
jgi:hypothetical protein